MNRYVAFLRGINMIGHRPTKMETIQKVFEELDYQNVKTIGASGNVLFDAPKGSPTALVEDIEESLEKASGHAIRVIIRTVPELQVLADSEPFQGIVVTPYTKCHITFLSEKPNSTVSIPYTSPENDFMIVGLRSNDVCSVAILSPTRQRTGLLSFLEREFGRDLTTRNWSTIKRILNR